MFQPNRTEKAKEKNATQNTKRNASKSQNVPKEERRKTTEVDGKKRKKKYVQTDREENIMQNRRQTEGKVAARFVFGVGFGFVFSICGPRTGGRAANGLAG